MLTDSYLEQFARIMTEECVFVILLHTNNTFASSLSSFREYAGIFLDFGPMAYETIPEEEMTNSLINKYMIAFADFLWNVCYLLSILNL